MNRQHTRELGPECTIDKESYSLLVNGNASLNSLIMGGNYDEFDPDVNVIRFELLPHSNGIRRVNGHLVRCPSLDIRRIIIILDEKDLAPADLHELLTFGIMHPHVQEVDTIIALGTLVQIHGVDQVPMLGSRNRNRYFGFIPVREIQTSWKLLTVPFDNNFMRRALLYT